MSDVVGEWLRSVNLLCYFSTATYDVVDRVGTLHARQDELARFRELTEGVAAVGIARGVSVTDLLKVAERMSIDAISFGLDGPSVREIDECIATVKEIQLRIATPPGSHAGSLVPATHLPEWKERLERIGIRNANIKKLTAFIQKHPEIHFERRGQRLMTDANDWLIFWEKFDRQQEELEMLAFEKAAAKLDDPDDQTFLTPACEERRREVRGRRAAK